MRDCIRDAHKPGFSVVEFSVQHNHVHLVIEADDRSRLAKGMQGLKKRITHSLNRLWGRVGGTVFAERYHVVVLATPRQVRNALAYVLGNARRHAWQHGRHVFPPRWIDPYSSADSFAGWRERFAGAGPPNEVVGEAATWLLRKGWRRYGLLPVDEIPGRSP